MSFKGLLGASFPMLLVLTAEESFTVSILALLGEEPICREIREAEKA